jgi:CheY-like chemotaxis protein
VTLPAAPHDPAAAPGARRQLVSSPRDEADPPDRLRGVRVLVVDDEADTREVLRAMLAQAGATVDLASSVNEAREAFRRARPDALLCDIGLGSEDGYALLRAVRLLPAELGGGVPAIALTGYARPEDRERALEAGFDLHVAKPGPADLPTVVAGLLRR